MGVVEDPRSLDEKALDYKHEDLAMGEVPLNWVDIKDKVIKTYEIQNQDGSLSCVAQAVAKLLAIHELKEGRSYTRLCPKVIYDFRENYPQGGMWLPNALAIGCSVGACEETMLPCDMKGETFMNDKSLISAEMLNNALNYRGLYYFEITDRSIDNIAQVLAQDYGVLLGFRFDYDEWTDVPVVHADSTKKLGHGTAGTDYCLYEGEKSLNMDDSWGPGQAKGGTRIITERFLNARCFYAGYITSLPNFRFTKTLRYGSVGIDVRKLQEVLNKNGANIIIDGKFGNRTKVAVILYQKAHSLVGDGIVGPKTREVLNLSFIS